MAAPHDIVGIRDLKTHLSRHLKRVRAGARLVVTERGRKIATISPVHAPATAVELEWADAMVDSGQAEWSGGKPQGAARPVALTSGPSLSDTILDDRR